MPGLVKVMAWVNGVPPGAAVGSTQKTSTRSSPGAPTATQLGLRSLVSQGEKSGGLSDAIVIDAPN